MSGVRIFEKALSDLSGVFKSENVPYMIIFTGQTQHQTTMG
jgi:hypothetical protein